MAEKTKMKVADKRSRKPAKKAKASSGSRIKKWFTNIITELKRVIWPDRKKLRQSTVTVLLIIAISVVIILVFDTLITFIMRTTGIYSTKDTQEEALVEPVDGINATGWRDESGQALLVAQGVRISFEG